MLQEQLFPYFALGHKRIVLYASLLAIFLLFLPPPSSAYIKSSHPRHIALSSCYIYIKRNLRETYQNQYILHVTKHSVVYQDDQKTKLFLNFVYMITVSKQRRAQFSGNTKLCMIIQLEYENIMHACDWLKMKIC